MHVTNSASQRLADCDLNYVKIFILHTSRKSRFRKEILQLKVFHRTQIGVCRQQKGKTPSSYPPHGKITLHRHRTEKLHRQQHKLYGILTLSSVSMPHFRNPCGQESLMPSRHSSDDSEEDRYKPQPYPLAIDVLKNTTNPI